MMLALKVDVDTFDGARDGVPRLLELFAELRIRGTFFFPFGPDNAGKAIWNVFRRGFLSKMLRTRALRLYGLRTALSGTLLPARVPSRALEAVLERVRDEGHEVGVHGFDHRLWQDRLHRMPADAIERELDRACAEFERLFGDSPRAFAAPGWVVDERAQSLVDERGFAYTSSTRFGHPFYPLVGGRRSRTLEVPSTTVCPEEILGRSSRDPVGEILDGVVARGENVVYPAHAEVEGRWYREGFRSALERVIAAGVEIVPVAEIARAATDAPERALRSVAIPGRAFRVATGVEIYR